MITLNEFSQEPLIGYILQELSAPSSEARILKDNGKVVKFETVLQDDKPNRNKRLYPKNVLAEAIQSARVQELLKARSLFGEAGHPFSSEMNRQMVIDQTRISHLITELNTPNAGGIVEGVIETAATSCGRDMRGLIVENGSRVAFSMRGMGGCKRVPGKDLVEVTSPLALFTYDWVSFPSHSGAYQKVMIEGCEPVSLIAATQYAKDQSKNVFSLTEQFELENPEFNLTEDQMNMIIRSNTSVIKVFLEEDIRQEFRNSLLNMF